MRIALIGRQRQAYSETFIRVLRDRLSFPIRYMWEMGYQCEEGSIDKIFSKSSFTECLKAYFIQHNIRVVFAQFGQTGVHVLQACIEAKIPLVVHFHGFDAYKHSVLIDYKGRYQEMFSYAASIIAVSKDMIEQLITIGAPKHKLVYAPYGPNGFFFRNSPDFLNRHFVAVGRFVDKKAPYLTMMAFKEVVERYSDAKLVMIGNGVLFDVCYTLAYVWGLLDNIEFLGIKEHSEVQEILNRSFCFVQHSVVSLDCDAEGTPVAILEASAAALPIVATRHKGIRDVVVDGETGFLVDERDTREMAKRMIFLIENPDIAKCMGLNGRKYVREKFSMDQYLNIIEKTLTNCLQ